MLNLYQYFKNMNAVTKKSVAHQFVANLSRKELDDVTEIIENEKKLSDDAIAEGQEVDDRTKVETNDKKNNEKTIKAE